MLPKGLHVTIKMTAPITPDHQPGIKPSAPR